ncbi:MAG: sulfotransferase family protein [Methylophagaceae bacterium]
MTPKHIHIVGCLPRSGTTLMTELMLSCFEIDGYTEHEYSIFKEYPSPYKVLCTKKPNDIKYIDYPLRVNEDLYVIYMLRDPRDAISSRSHKKAINGKKLWGNLQTWFSHQHIAKNLSAETSRFITVRYEDLVTNPDKTQQYIQDKIPFLQGKVKFSEYHLVATPSERTIAALGGLRPISAASIGNWRGQLAYLKAQIQKYGDLTNPLIDLGYEKDSNWMSELEAISPDNTDEKLKEKAWYKRLWRNWFMLPRRRLFYRISCSTLLGMYLDRIRWFLRKRPS